MARPTREHLCTALFQANAETVSQATVKLFQSVRGPIVVAQVCANLTPGLYTSPKEPLARASGLYRKSFVT